MLKTKSQSFIAGIIFLAVFASLFYILMRYGDLNSEVKDVMWMNWNW